MVLSIAPKKMNSGPSTPVRTATAAAVSTKPRDSAGCSANRLNASAAFPTQPKMSMKMGATMLPSRRTPHEA